MTIGMISFILSGACNVCIGDVPNTAGPPTKKSEAILKSVSKGIGNVLLEAQELTFTAHLTRRTKRFILWKETHYKADVKMGVGTLETKVYDLDSSPDEPIAVIIQEKGKKPRVTKRDQSVDGCLFGTLQESWIGPYGSPPSFVEKILQGRLEGKADFKGKKCYVISYSGEARIGSWMDTFYVDAEFLPVKWLTIETSMGEVKPWMICTRVYTNLRLKGKER